MSDAITTNLEVIRSETTKIHDVDFDNLGFGKVYTDHMMVCDYKNGVWNMPKIVCGGFSSKTKKGISN